ncbi:MAG: aldehyde ferredoxin oxidoreductase family protein, partial [Candidatus Poribacteria bacterium]
DGTISQEEQDDLFYRRYFGGVSLIAYYLLKEVPPEVEPLSPENRLIFALGPVTGVPLAGSGRNAVGAKSPLSNGFGKAEVGGFWGAELKRAGFDAIVVEGKAEQPVYLWVHDGEAEIKSAKHLWGQPTKECQEMIRSELDDKNIRVAQIGPGGENQVRFACVINDLKDAAGRTGMGAVMGSKNLKAIAVRGRQSPELYDAEALRNINRWLAQNYQVESKNLHQFGTGANMDKSTLTGNIPTRNWRDGIFEKAGDISANAVRDTIRIGMEGCYACPIRCKKVVEIGEPYSVDPDYGGPEYETLAALGANCGVDDLKAISKGHHLCGAYSLDTISTGSTIAFAMECFERGLLTKEDTGGVELTFGNAEAMLTMIEKIAKREDIGDLLAEGTMRAAEKIGGGSERFAMQVKGVDLGMHEARLKFGLGLGYAVVCHGADHGAGLHDTAFAEPGPALEAIKTLGFLEPLPANDLSPRKVAMFKDLHSWRTFIDCMVICGFLPYNHKQITEIVESVTSVLECMRVGERAITMARAFNMIHGLSAADDRLPLRIHEPFAGGPLKGVAIGRDDMEKAIHTYYKIMGWDEETGAPTNEKLAELGIDWVAELLGE